MYIDNIRMRNFKCFADTEFELNHPLRDSGPQHSNGSKHLRTKNVNLFLGQNGTGKTSVFRAAAISLLAPVLPFSGFTAEYLVRQTKLTKSLPLETPAQIYSQFVVTDSDSLLPITEVTYPAKIDTAVSMFSSGRFGPSSAKSHPEALEVTMENDESSAVFVAGYSANRRTERPEGYDERNRKLRYQRVAGIFESHVGLMPFELGVSRLRNQKRFTESRNLLNRQLKGHNIQLSTHKDKTDVPLFDVDGVFLPFDALSDGYRTYIGWFWDLLVHIARVVPDDTKINEMAGIVMVDEIDLFLHPSWQRTVVETVAETFPNIQFLFSTHSPIVAATLEPQNIFVMDTDENGAAVVRQYKEPISGRTADQVLNSSYFGLDTSRSPEMMRQLQQLSKSAETDYGAAQRYLQLLKEGL